MTRRPERLRPRLVLDFLRQNAAGQVSFSRSGDKLVWQPDNTLVSIGPNVIAYSSDPIGVDPSFTSPPEIRSRGILIEDTLSQTLLQTNNFTDAVWVKVGNPSVGLSGVPSPEAGINATTLSSSSNSQDEGIQQTRTITNNTQQHTALIYATPGSRSNFRIECDMTGGSTPLSGGAQVDLAAETITVYGDADSEILHHVTQNGWYRAAFKMTNNGTGNTSLTYRLLVGLQAIHTGNIRIYQADCWPDSTNTSPIKAGANPVNRAADNLTVSTANWLNPHEGTFLIRGKMGRNKDGPGIFQLDAGSDNNRINCSIAGQNQVAVTTGGVNQGTIQGPGHGSYTDFQVAVSYRPGFVSYVESGRLNGIMQGVSLPSSFTTLRLGRASGTGPYLRGHLSRVEYFPKYIPERQLIRLTRR